MDKFGGALKRFRNSLGLNQKEFAAELKMKPPLYQRYESGKTTPSIEFIYKVTDKYGVSSDYLLGLSDEPKPQRFDEKTLDLLRAMEARFSPSKGPAQ